MGPSPEYSATLHTSCVYVILPQLHMAFLRGAREYRYGQMRRGGLIYITMRESSSILDADLSAWLL